MERKCTIERVSPWHVRLTFDGPMDHSLTTQLIALSEAFQASPAVSDATHGYRTLMIETTLSTEEIEGLIDHRQSVVPSPRSLNIAVTYDGPDLPWVAEHLGLSADEVIGRHVGRYHVVALGSPGFTYLSTTRDLTVPRLETPRRSVPAGAVGLAGLQTGVYGKERPGGWRIIGRCKVPDLKPGDHIRFHAA